MSFVFRFKSVEELNRSPPIGVRSADTSRLSRGRIAWTIPTNFQITQSGISIVFYTSVPIDAALCTNRVGQKVIERK
jgi:hypothetical protein